MHKSTKSRLVQLNAKLGKRVELIAKNPDDDQMNTAEKVAIGAGTLAAGYGAGSLLRGRAWQKKVIGAPDNSVSGLLGALKTGHNANVADVSKFVAPAASAIGKAAGGAGTAIGSAANSVASTATKYGRSATAATLIAARRAKALIPGAR